MAQGFCFLFKLFQFAFLQICIIQLFMLEAHKLLVLTVLGNLGFQFFQKFLGFAIGIILLLVNLELVGILSDDIHHIQLEVFFLQKKILMLRMDIHELLSQFSHTGERHRGVIDEGTALAGCSQLSSDDCIIGIIVDVVIIEEFLHTISGEIEVSLYHASVSSSLDRLAVGTVTQKQSDGTEDDTLSCSCLTRDDGEARIERDVQLVDEREVLDI